MSKRSSLELAGCLACAVVGVLGILAVRSCGDFLHTAAGGCSREADELNAACSSLEGEELQLSCSSSTGTREWAACERRNTVRIAWEQAPDSGWQSRPYASGVISHSKERPDAGTWWCVSGNLTLWLDPTSIPEGEEGRARVAIDRACARFVQLAK